MFDFLRRRRREGLRSAPFPTAWAAILDRNCPFVLDLSDDDRAVLHGLIRIFLDEKHFEGCGGLELTDEIRVTIAAEACRLILRRGIDHYRKLITILVYPTAYVADCARPIGGGLVLEGRECRLGEASPAGVVVLSWDDVRAGAADLHDGQNVVLHEFAHQLDHEDGTSDGAPILDHRSRYVTWARVLGAEYEQLRRDAEHGRPSELDPYGATAPAEFFAVATECFFEKPGRLQRKHPELYDALRDYYRQDPARREPAGR